MSSNIQLLSKMFKLDLTSFIKTELTQANFIEHHSIVSEILNELFTSNPNHVDLQSSCDKILGLCLNDLFNECIVESDIILKYVRLCASHCSSLTFTIFFNSLIAYFIKLAMSKGK